MKESRTFKSLNVKSWFKPKRGGEDRMEAKDIPWDRREEYSKQRKKGKKPTGNTINREEEGHLRRWR